jgi:hypothetical protein
MKLKALPDDGEYNRAMCAGFRCNAECSTIDGTHRIWDLDVPLCDRCWASRDAAYPLSPPEPVEEEVRVRRVPTKAKLPATLPDAAPPRPSLPGLRAIQARMARRLAEQTG